VVAKGVKGTIVNRQPVSGGQVFEAVESAGGGSSSGSSGGGGGSSSRLEDLVIEESSTHSGGNYQDVTITDAVGDGEVTLTDLKINGDLVINGGGSGTVHLVRCVIRGRIIINKQGGETPRVLLTETPVATLVAEQPAIVEAADGSSAVNTVKAAADVTVQGTQTEVAKVSVAAPEADSAPVITVADGAAVTAVEVQTPAAIEADASASVATETPTLEIIGSRFGQTPPCSSGI